MFLKSKSKKEQVFDFIRRRGRAKTSEVAEFGIKIFHPDRACRDARDLAQIGRIGRLRADLKYRFYGKIGEDIWTIYEHEYETNV